MTTRGQPRFVVLEGLDGAGTTTQAEMLAGALEERGLPVCLTAEPSGGPLGAVARAHVRGEISLDPLTTALTFVADRAEHLARVVEPALEGGEWVVCDRYVLSTLAYQGAEGVDRLWVLDASGPLRIPDLTIFLDVPARTRSERMAARGAPERYEAADLQSRLETSYTESIQIVRSRGYPVALVDGTGEKTSVAKAVLGELDALP